MSTAARLRALLVLVLMCGAAVAGHWLQPSAKLADTRPHVSLEQIFPRTFGDWQVDDRMPAQLVSPDTAALLSMLSMAKHLARVEAAAVQASQQEPQLGCQSGSNSEAAAAMAFLVPPALRQLRLCRLAAGCRRATG